jgi:3',5'-cyclic-AMP phosphodiesterase
VNNSAPLLHASNPGSELRILHLTDTHLLDASNATLFGLNTRENLQLVLAHAVRLYSDVDYLLFTGDISQTGSEQSYQIFQSIIADYDIPILCVPGNHDTPDYLNKIIPSSPTESIVCIQQDRFSIILINSWVEGAHHGIVDDRCLNQLEQYLKSSQSEFNILAIHHPPAHINSKWLDELGLKNQSDLLQIIDSNPKPSILLSGHIHQQLDIQLNHLRLLATPSTCHQFENCSDKRQHQDLSQAAFRYIKISLPRQIETTVHFVESDEAMIS